MSDIDLLRECERCGVVKHKSWFDVGRRHCKSCELEKAVSFEAAQAKVELEDAQIPDEMIQIVRTEAKPEGISSGHWRLLHLIDRCYDDVGIALQTSLPSQDVPRRKHEAILALYREAQRRADLRLGIARHEDDGTYGRS